MHSYTKPSQLFLTLYICSSLTLFLQTGGSFSQTPLTCAIIAAAASSLIIAAFFIPSYLLARKTGGDIFTLTRSLAPAAQVLLSAFYSLFFVYACACVLDVFVKMMTGCVNPEANAYVLGVCLLLVCVYAAVKGMGAVTRCAVIIFAFIVLSLILIFSGNISNIELSNIKITELGGFEISSGMLSLLPSTLSGAIFAVLCSNAKGKRGKGLAVYIISLALTFFVFVFFLISVLAAFGENAAYPFFTLSKASQLTVFRGFDSFYLAGATFAAFILISILLVCINKSVNRGHSVKNTLMFALPVYILFACSQVFDSVSRILQNPYVFVALCFIAAVLIPLVYLAIFGRKRNA